MNRFLVFGVLTIVMLFHYVSADIKPIMLQDLDKNNDQIQPLSVGLEKFIRLPRTLTKGCNTCGNQGGGQGGGGGVYSSSSSSSSAGSFSGGYPGYGGGGGGGYPACSTCG